MEHNPVGWFEIYVQDMDRARQFYESVFQLKLEKLDSPALEMLAFPMHMEGTGASGALIRMPGVPLAATVYSSTLVASIALVRQTAWCRLVDASRRRRPQLVSTASSPWPTIQKVIRLAFIPDSKACI